MQGEEDARRDYPGRDSDNGGNDRIDNDRGGGIPDSDSLFSSGGSRDAARGTHGISEPAAERQRSDQGSSDAADSQRADGGEPATTDSGNSPTRKRRKRRSTSAGAGDSSSGEEKISDQEVSPGLEEEEEPVPDFVKGFSNLLSDKPTRGRKPSMAPVLGQGWEIVFSVPVYAGYGIHWQLSEEESKALGKATESLLKSLPARTKAKIEKQLSQVIPIAYFMVTLGGITYPRIMRTQHLMQEMRRARQPVPENKTSNPAADNGTAAGAGKTMDWLNQQAIKQDESQ